MEPTKQGVPAGPSSSQQQPQPYPPQRALQPEQRVVQQQQQYPPPSALLPPHLAVQRPQLPPAPTAAQGLAPTAVCYMPWRPQQFYGAWSHLPMLQPRSWGYIPRVGVAIPGSINASHVVDPRSWTSAPATVIPRGLTLDGVRDHLRVRQLVAGDVDLAGSSAFVAQLLMEGSEVVRRNVFYGVLSALRFFMGTSEWSVVFVELLRARRLDELQDIVSVACNGEVSLLGVADDECGLTSLESLFEAVEPHPKMRRQLINRLLEEGLFHHRKGPELLRSIFTTFPDKEDSSIVIQKALDTFSDVVSTTLGSYSMIECLAVTRNDKVHELGDIILSHTVQLARGQLGNYFLQRVLERGGDLLKANITDRVVEHLVSLSLDRYGFHVVQACFLRRGPVLQRVLTEFRRLPDRQLARLVKDRYANQVVRKLLKVGKHGSPEETVELARRIQTLPAAGLERVDQTVPVRKVMEAVGEVLS